MLDADVRLRWQGGYGNAKELDCTMTKLNRMWSATEAKEDSLGVKCFTMRGRQ